MQIPRCVPLFAKETTAPKIKNIRFFMGGKTKLPDESIINTGIIDKRKNIRDTIVAGGGAFLVGLAGVTALPSNPVSRDIQKFFNSSEFKQVDPLTKLLKNAHHADCASGRVIRDPKLLEIPILFEPPKDKNIVNIFFIESNPKHQEKPANTPDIVCEDI